MRFAFIDAWKEDWSVEFLCRIMKVTSRGFRAWRVRPMSQRQRDDMVLLAHIREQHRLSLQSYGRPRMTEELQELGLNVGHGRVGRLMRENGIKVIRTQKYKATTDSDHTFNIAPNLLDQDFTTDGPNQKWAGDLERFQFSLKQGYRQCPESAEGVAGYWRSNINWKRFRWQKPLGIRTKGRLNAFRDLNVNATRPGQFKQGRQMGISSNALRAPKRGGAPLSKAQRRPSRLLKVRKSRCHAPSFPEGRSHRGHDLSVNRP